LGLVAWRSPNIIEECMISGGTPCINWIISSTIYFILKVGLQRMGFELGPYQKCNPCSNKRSFLTIYTIRGLPGSMKEWSRHTVSSILIVPPQESRRKIYFCP
jgi:hypothetical protein